MSSRKKKPEAPARVPRARSAHNRQRQRLIDACISALHIFGPSRTTVEKVVAIAKMSPGIVRFYFDSKAAMLVASLQFLAAEFEEQVLLPVSKLKQSPVAALELLVDLYLDPEIASPRKVSVWYAFWGEASSRQEYYDICGQKDESFAALVRELIRSMIAQTSQNELDPDGIALGLIGVLEMLWQDFAFRSEGDIDRQAAKRRCMAYLRSVFPGRFASLLPQHHAQAAGAPRALPSRLAGWVYGSERALALERDALFRESWQIVAHESQLAHAGDFLTADIAVERVLVVRDAYGDLRVLRNSCPQVPHALVGGTAGRFDGVIECPAHALKFDLDGRSTAGGVHADLCALDTQLIGGFLMVKSSPVARAPAALSSGLDGIPSGLQAQGPRQELEVAANWKLIVEQWLAAASVTAAPGPPADFLAWSTNPLDGASRWSAQRYRRLVQPASQGPWLHRFIAPNQLLQARPDGLSILSVVPTAPGRCRLERLRLALGAAGRIAEAAEYLAARLQPLASRSALALAESTQQGVIDFGYRAAAGSPVHEGVAWFRQYCIARAPGLGSERPPTEAP
jgi:TetR/AcrR family transcriptional repressor of bet genes